jgi:hypothetical protein
MNGWRWDSVHRQSGSFLRIVFFEKARPLYTSGPALRSDMRSAHMGPADTSKQSTSKQSNPPSGGAQILSCDCGCGILQALGYNKECSIDRHNLSIRHSEVSSNSRRQIYFVPRASLPMTLPLPSVITPSWVMWRWTLEVPCLESRRTKASSVSPCGFSYGCSLPTAQSQH